MPKRRKMPQRHPKFEKHLPMRQPDITLREWEYLELIAAGLDHVEIGYKLYVSPQTVKNTLRRIRMRWDARNTAHMVHLAWTKGYFNHLGALAPRPGIEPGTK